MVSYRLALAILAVLAASAVVEARVFHDVLSSAGRQLQAAVNTECPAGCDIDGNGCVPDATSGGYRCIKCKASLIVNNEDGRCHCAAGRYASADDTCTDCPKGSYCAGGQYVAASTPDKTACPSPGLMTTLGKRSTTIKACVNIQGTKYTYDAGTSTPGAESCPADTYGPGFRKQRACVPCPTGFTTNTATGQYRATDCVVPAGYFLKGPGQVAVCPKGEWKAGTTSDATCTKCAIGVTTASEGSTVETACNTLLPGVYASAMAGTIITETKACPQRFYCPEGEATAIFDATATTPVAVEATMKVVACPDQTWTESFGASSPSQCMTPPGHFTANSLTTECALGSYRAEWKPASQAAACDLCGVGIQTDAASLNDQISVYSKTDYTETKMSVATASSACFIQPGQGMYFSPVDNKFRAENCITNSYGVKEMTTGLAAFPCRSCPAGLVTASNATDTTYQTSAGFYQTHTPFGSITPQGFTDPKACVTQAGWGYNGRVATQCHPGSWNPADAYSTCTQCDAGLTTSTDAAKQAIVGDCKVAPGFGTTNGGLWPLPCYYRAGLGATTDNSDVCVECDTGLTTSRSGAAASTECDVCKVGWGDSGGCGTRCGGSAADATDSTAATYGPAGRDVNPLDPDSSKCLACPDTMAVGFSFDYKGVNQLFKPISVARTGASSGADCLAQFAQIEDLAWSLPAITGLSTVTGVSTFDDCAAACTGDCQFVTFTYGTVPVCQKKVTNATMTDGDVLAFKAVLAGDIAASSVKDKNLVSGSYTFWAETAAADLGKAQTTNDATTVTACLAACDSNSACAAVIMKGVTAGSDAITGSSCKLVTGDTTVAQWKRSATKAIVTKLTKTAALA